jgi:integrase
MARPHKIWYRPARKAWYVEIDGRQVKLLKGPKDADTKELAEQAFHRLMVERAVQPPLDIGPSRLTVAALIDGYLDTVKRDLAERTWYERRRILEQFAQFLVDSQVLLVKDCLPLHMVLFLNAHPSWKSRDTKAEVVKAVKVVFNWGHDAKIAPPNPFVGKLLEGYTFGNTRRPMTEEEFRRLIEACGKKQTRLREILQFCFWTGARPCEARTARWSDLDVESGTITLKEHKTAKIQKVYSPRVIVLDDQTVRLLIGIRQRQPATVYIFTSRLGRPYHRNSIQQNLRRLRRRVKLPEDVKLYGCRHGFGTRAVLNGTDLATLGQLLGHEKDSRITGHYVHLAGEHAHLKEALRAINRPSSSGECA